MAEIITPAVVETPPEHRTYHQRELGYLMLVETRQHGPRMTAGLQREMARQASSGTTEPEANLPPEVYLG